MKYKLKQYLALSLSVLTLVTSIPITSLAAPDVGGSADNNDSSSSSTGGGGDFGCNGDIGRIGVRFSLVDAYHPEEVISVNESGSPMVFDVLYTNSPNWTFLTGLDKEGKSVNGMNGHRTNLTSDNEYSSVKTQDFGEKNEINRWFWEEFEAKIGSSSEMPHWMTHNGSRFLTNGKAFQTWFFTDHSGKLNENTGFNNTTGGGNTGGGVTTTNRKGKKENVKYANKGTTNKANSSSKNSNNHSNRNPTNTSNDFRNIQQRIDGNSADKLKGSLNPATWDMELKMGVAKYMKDTDKKLQSDINLAYQNRKITKDEKDKLNKKLEGNKKSINGLKGTRYSAVDKKSLSDRLFNTITSYAAPIEKEESKVEETGAVNDTPIRDDGTVGNALAQDANIYRILSLRNADNSYVFQTKETLGTGKSIVEEKNWVLLVEPILYYTIYSEGNTSEKWNNKMYGTITNFADAFMTVPRLRAMEDRNRKHFNWKATNEVAWGALAVANEGFTFPNGYKLYGKDTADGFNVGAYKSFKNLHKWNQTDCVYAENENHVLEPLLGKVGYGVNVYYSGKLLNGDGSGSGDPSNSSINTWDSTNFPTGLPGKPEDASSKDSETTFKELSKKFNIVKWYCTDDEATNTETTVNVKVREDVPHKVNILNEGIESKPDENKYYWEVVKWATGKDKVLPTEDDTNTTYEEYCSRNSGELLGTEPNILELTPEDKDQVLYVKLVLRIIPKKPDVVKVYETNGVTDRVTIEKDQDITNAVYPVRNPDGEYTYKEATTSPEIIETAPSGWGEVPKDNPTTNDMVPVPDEISTIYIRYEKVGAEAIHSNKITLNENEITHQFSLGNLVEGGILASLSREYMGIEDRDCTYSWETTSDTIVNADGTTTGGDTETEYCSNSLSKNYKDTGYGYGVTNRNHGYDKNMVYQTEESDTTVSGTADNMSGFTGNSFTPNMNFILNRSYSDKVTLYPNLNGGDTGQLRDIGTLEEAYTPKGQRYNGLKETDTRQQWTGSFKTGFVWDSLSDPTGEWVEDNHGENGGDWTQTSSESGNGNGVASLNNIYSQPDNFNILVYLGKTGVGNVVPSTEKAGFKIGDKAFKFFLYTRQDTSKKINFYPAVKMVYQTLGSENNGAYVTSENPSSLLNVSRVDTAVSRSSAKLPLSLESYQWSGHMRTLEMLSNKDIDDKSSVLPGGAAYQLKTGNSSDNASTMWVGFRTYQTCLDDSNMIKLSNADGILSLSKAEENYNTFRDTAKNNLEHFQIEQWVAEGIIKDYDEFISANPVLVSGLGEESSFKGNTLDRSSKYYLKVDGTGANRADLDVLDSVEEKITWEISSDTDGNVRVNKNGTEVASINKTQSISSLLGNAELKELDEKTKVITNFVNSIDRNKGSDRDGNAWYNEEFKSIKVLEAVCGFRVGFGGAETIRGSILDTKLTGHLSDRRDLYNYSAETLKEKTRTSMFLLSKKSTTSVAGKYPGYVGTLNGVDVVIPFIDRLMQSKLFYIPNATVTDLN